VKCLDVFSLAMRAATTILYRDEEASALASSYIAATLLNNPAAGPEEMRLAMRSGPELLGRLVSRVPSGRIIVIGLTAAAGGC
jgi:hypothetical protein